jgi:hypothetical protein
MWEKFKKFMLQLADLKCDICSKKIDYPYYTEIHTETCSYYCKNCFTDYFIDKIHTEKVKRIRVAIKEDTTEFKKLWPTCPIKISRNDYEWFITIGNWEIYKTKEYTNWLFDKNAKRFDEGILEIIWGVSSGVTEDDLSLCL